MHVLSPDQEAAPFGTKTGLQWLRQRHQLEQTADYWLAAANMHKASGNPRPSGAALAVAIRLGRAEALRSGAKPVPDRLKRLLRNHNADRVLDEAHWLVVEPGSRLGRVLARWPVKEGGVTLGNVIVFKTQIGSRNRSLFAHELAYVEQYAELGIASSRGAMLPTWSRSRKKRRRSRAG